jgi:surface carbohydrate biosynthesis protein (TIGR04326 family)
MSSKVFELLDEKIDSKIKASPSFLWEEHFREGNFISIPKLLDEKSIIWKNTYLQWTYELAMSLHEGRELYKHFKSQLIHNESFWWQSLIADKCPYKSKSPYLIIKLWILEELYIKGKYDQLIYRGKDEKLAKVLSDWLKKNNLGKFFWQKNK